MPTRFYVSRFAFVTAIILVVTSLLVPSGLAQEPPPPVQPPAFAPGELLVKFKPGISALSAQGSLNTAGLQPLEVFPQGNVIRLEVPPGQELAKMAELMARGDVEVAEPNYIAYALDTLPNDSFYSNQWGLTKIGAPAAWDITTGGSNVVIAVVDTGIDLSHPDFSCSGKLLPGWDFVHDSGFPDDDHGHGSHVAGIAAACANNGAGITGLAWGARLLPVKVLDSLGNGYYSNVAEGIRYAADQGARIINLSLGGPSTSVILEDAIQYAYNRGALVVAAAGNCAVGGWGCGSTLNPIFYPAAYPTVLAVAATDENDNRASFSEYHPYVAVAAPGLDIYSTFKDGEYTSLSGTSMATPYVSGLAALIWSLDPSSSRDQVRSVMETTADDLGSPGKDDYFGYGRINARRALAQLTSISLQDSSGRDLTQSGVSFVASAQEGPFPASFNVLVTTHSTNAINWTVTVPPEATWLQVVPLTSNITSSGTPGQFTLVATRPGSFGAHSVVVTVTGSNSSGTLLGTASVTVQIIYVSEFENVYMPLIVK